MPPCRAAVLVSRERAEDHAVRQARRFERARRERRAFLLQGEEADFLALPFQTELEQGIGAIENGERGRGDLRTDSVAGENEKSHCAGIFASRTSFAYF